MKTNFEISQNHANEIIETICQRLKIKSEKKIKEIYHQLYVKTVSPRCKLTWIAASIYAGCRMDDELITYRQISNETGSSRHSVLKKFLQINKRLNLNLKRITDEQLVHKFCDELGFSIEVKELSIETCSRFRKLETGKHQQSIVVGSILCSCDKLGVQWNFVEVLSKIGSISREAIKSSIAIIISSGILENDGDNEINS
eukprot:gene1769-538_t